jgi:hypothetical protein
MVRPRAFSNLSSISVLHQKFSTDGKAQVRVLFRLWIIFDARISRRSHPLSASPQAIRRKNFLTFHLARDTIVVPSRAACNRTALNASLDFAGEVFICESDFRNDFFRAIGAKLANALSIAEDTVKIHLRNILEKNGIYATGFKPRCTRCAKGLCRTRANNSIG